MSRSSSSRIGDVKALARVVRALPAGGGWGEVEVEVKRAMIAQFCRMIGQRFSAPAPDLTAGLSPRRVQTLRRLLAGDSEKQIAVYLGISRHTVHVYVKGLYRHFEVSSRGELLARFVSPPAFPASARPASPD